MTLQNSIKKISQICESRFTAIFLISIATFFVQPLFIPLAHEKLGYSMIDSSLLFAVVIGLSGILQFYVTNLIQKKEYFQIFLIIGVMLIGCLLSYGTNCFLPAILSVNIIFFTGS